MYYSVIVPTYNEEEYIERCLRSIIQQDIDRKEFEIIVSDASSKDRTLDLTEGLADHIVITKERGIAIGRNHGAEQSIGEILVFVDADTVLKSDFLSKCGYVFSNLSIVGMTGIANPSDGGIFQKLVYKCTYILVRIFNVLGLSLFPGICVAYRRKVFSEAGGFREDFGIVEDLDLSRRISRIGRCVINKDARVLVSTRRLKNNMLATVIFHLYNDLKYICTGKAAVVYPKTEEINSWRDLWKQRNAG